MRFGLRCRGECASLEPSACLAIPILYGTPTTGRESLLAIEHLRVDFPEVVAVNDLSLKIEPGDVCGLIGPNGAGKTTTMRAVSGLQEFTRGSVRLGGHELAHEPDELKKRLGFMPDFCPTYDQLTASEFLEHFARAFECRTATGASRNAWNSPGSRTSATHCAKNYRAA